jgi:signal peptidase I
VAFALALLIKTFLVQAFFIPSESMQNTLNPGDRVLVNKVVYHLHTPRRGDIIVFSDPNPAPTGHRNPAQAFWHWLTEGLGVSTNPEKDFIKRVIGLPGETIEGKDGTVYIDGRPLTERYTRVKDVRPFGPIRIPADRLFVMGDNRTDSKDSRYGLGFIPYRKVIGRAFVVIWPPSRIGWLHGT